jgi:hypothetical protein
MSVGSWIPVPNLVFRYLCLLTAIANCAGSVGLVLFYKPLLEWVGAPLPPDPYTFTAVAGFAFTIGAGAFLVFLDPQQNRNVLVVGILGKGMFAVVTFYFWTFHNLHWFYGIFGAWDAVYSIIFVLFLTQLVSPDLTRFNRGDLMVGLDRPRTNQALMLIFSLTGTGQSGMDHLRVGLERNGYKVDVKYIQAQESIFRFPMSFSDFVRIIARAFLRIPARVAPLNIPHDHDYDLIVVEAQTWMVGMSAPVEAVFQGPDGAAICQARDVAVLNVARGAWRRPQAQLLRWVQRCGGNVVGARAYTHIGWEPSRLFSLWFYLIYHAAGKPTWLDGFVQPRYGISDQAFAQLETFGEELAGRPRLKCYGSTVTVPEPVMARATAR